MVLLAGKAAWPLLLAQPLKPAMLRTDTLSERPLCGLNWHAAAPEELF